VSADADRMAFAITARRNAINSTQIIEADGLMFIARKRYLLYKREA